MKRNILSRGIRKAGRMVPGRTPHLDEIDFQSGLGDSAYLLYGLARAMKPAVAVEIGSARGKSACFVGTALKENGKGKLFAIDPHTRTDWNDANSVDTLEHMRRNLRRLKVEGQVQIIRDTSQNVAARWGLPIDMLFIDGDHSYDGVKRDWDLFTPYVSEFGLVVFHDTLWSLNSDSPYSRPDMGVPAFVEELRERGYPVTTLSHDYGVSVVQPRIGGVRLTRSQDEAARSSPAPADPTEKQSSRQ